MKILNWFLLCVLHFVVAKRRNAKTKNTEFQYHDCGGKERAIFLKELNAHPKQFYIPQNISLSVTFEILKNIQPPIRIQIHAAKRLPLLGYVKLPCIANYGSCTFENACNILDTYPKDSFAYSMVCPKWLKATGFDCRCPIKRGFYRSKNVIAKLANTIVPKWIASGDYKVQLKMDDMKQTLGCFKFQFRLD